MKMECKRCGNKHFNIDNVNGILICSLCGNNQQPVSEKKYYVEDQQGILCGVFANKDELDDAIARYPVLREAKR